MTIAYGLLTFALLPVVSVGQAVTFTLPAGTPLPVTTPVRLPMRVGAPIRGELLYPVYAGDRLVLPAKTVVSGTVVSLKSDRSRRWTARLRADFTPFHTPVVRFDEIVRPDGGFIPIQTSDATDGAPVYRIVPAAAPRGGLVGQYFEFALGYVRDTINVIVGPEKTDRLKQFVYSQLPYHPERIEKGTAWTTEIMTPLTLAAVAAPAVPPAKPAPTGRVARFLHPVPAPAPANDDPATWTIEAYLDEGISSKTSRASQAIRATVARPVMNADGSVAVPQGAVLMGTITQAKPARKFARAGILRFNFSELKLPDQEAMHVRTSLRGADSASAAQLAMDSEGQVKPKAQDKILIPALLVVLASQPFDRDGHHGDAGMAGKDAVASSGLGLLSLIVGTAAQQPNFAIGIGYYSAALAIYPRYIAKGSEVSFPKDTRIVVQTTATRSRGLRAPALP